MISCGGCFSKFNMDVTHSGQDLQPSSKLGKRPKNSMFPQILSCTRACEAVLSSEKCLRPICCFFYFLSMESTEELQDNSSFRLVSCSQLSFLSARRANSVQTCLSKVEKTQAGVNLGCALAKDPTGNVDPPAQVPSDL